MDIEKQIYNSLALASLEEILEIKSINNLDWFWINSDIFEDILKNIPTIDYYKKEKEIKAFLKVIQEENFIKPLRNEISNRGFIESSQELFAKLDEDYRVLEDIETWIFIKESYYNKLWISKGNELEWILKAMAIDVYQRLDSSHPSLLETYKELFEGNNRILEDLLRHQKYVLESGKWILNRRMDILTFYKNNKIFNQWGEGEVQSKFNELQTS